MDNSLYFKGVNVRGWNHPPKRQNFMKWLKEPIEGVCAAINIVTETHCKSNKDAKKWGNEWSSVKRNSLWSKGTSNSKGVAILINENFQKSNPNMTITHKIIDPNGRYVKFILTVNDCKYRILGVYAPNNPFERIKFFRDIHDIVDDGVEAENIFGGDWNCAQNSIMDRYNCSSTNDLGQRDLSIVSDILDIEDIWRRRNPDTPEFTWRGRGRKSRIDYWLTSISLDNQIDKVFHCIAPYTDHSAINLVVNTEEVKRGPGLWKMNAKTLLDAKFRQEFTEMWTKWKSKKQNYSDVKVWWDLGKRHIKSFSIQFAKDSKQGCNQSPNDLKFIGEKIKELQKINADYEHLQQQYEEIFTLKAEGARVRSRIKCWEEGERSNKYFYGLEKRNAKEKLWSQIFDKNEKSLIGTQNIQKRQVEFYKDLYSSQNLSLRNLDYDFFLKGSNKALSPENKEFLDEDISNDEIGIALKKMANNKSPGPDGIVIEMYKIYWGLLGDDLCEVLKSGLEDQ